MSRGLFGGDPVPIKYQAQSLERERERDHYDVSHQPFQITVPVVISFEIERFQEIFFLNFLHSTSVSQHRGINRTRFPPYLAFWWQCFGS